MAKKSATRGNRAARKKTHPTKTSKHLAKPKALPKAGPTLATNGKAAAGSSKQATVLGMLSAPNGTTIAAIMKATGWQQHSVRGFLAGIVRKKLSLNLVSEVSNEGRLYRIKGGKRSHAVDETAKTA